MDKDYSKYQPSSDEIYYAARSNKHKYAYFNYFDNQARFDMDKKTVHLFIDNQKEDVSMQDVMDRSDSQHNLPLGDANLSQEDEKASKEIKIKNAKRKEYFAEKYNIDFSKSEYLVVYDEEKEEFSEPVNNIFCGANIWFQIGEGLLDYIYADFDTPYKEAYSLAYIFENILAKSAEEKPSDFPDASNNEPVLVLSEDDDWYEEYLKYKDTLETVGDISFASVYSAVCPPVFTDSVRKPFSGLKTYYKYLKTLQKEFAELIEFCFDEEFYPEILKHYKPHERFAIYKNAKDEPNIFSREETFRVTSFHIPGTPVSDFIKDKDFVVKEMKKIDTTPELSELANHLKISAENLKRTLVYPKALDRYYYFSSVYEILNLEFTKLLETDIRFKKCKRCGKYFIVNKNYPKVYCNRIANGETKPCSVLGPQESYRTKNSENEALNIYSKYYKRYKARVNVRQIHEADFKKWKYEALSKRNDCTMGSISCEEFANWNEAYFPNRTKKPSEN